MITINEIGRNVYLLLIEAGFNWYQAQLITSQAAHETANFSSKIFKENNNLFGYKYAGQKIAIGSRYGHAYYKSIEDSIEDYKNYYVRNNYLQSYPDIKTFASKLKEKRYFEADLQTYVKGMEHFYNLYFGN